MYFKVCLVVEIMNENIEFVEIKLLLLVVRADDRTKEAQDNYEKIEHIIRAKILYVVFGQRSLSFD